MGGSQLDQVGRLEMVEVAVFQVVGQAVTGRLLWLAAVVDDSEPSDKFLLDDPNPSKDFPGYELAEEILGWLKWLALAGSLASLLVGAAVWGLAQQGGNTFAASRGRSYALGGAAGAIVTGLAAEVVNQLSGLQ